VSRGIALPFHDLGTVMVVCGQHIAPAALPQGKTWYPFRGGWVGPRAGLDG